MSDDIPPDERAKVFTADHPLIAGYEDRISGLDLKHYAESIRPHGEYERAFAQLAEEEGVTLGAMTFLLQCLWVLYRQAHKKAAEFDSEYFQIDSQVKAKYGDGRVPAGDPLGDARELALRLRARAYAEQSIVDSVFFLEICKTFRGVPPDDALFWVLADGILVYLEATDEADESEDEPPEPSVTGSQSVH